MPKKKKLVPNSGKSIAEIMKDNEVTDARGGISQAFTKNYEYFVDINCIYSQEYPEGKMLELLHIVLYCRFKSYQANEKTCYESQERLGQLFRCDAGTIGDKIEELEKMGLVKKDPHPNSRISTLIYTALDITDAHIIPPDQLPAVPESDVVQQQPEPAPEPATPEKLNVPDLDDLPFVCDAPDYATAEPKSVSLREMITDDVTIDALCDLLSKPDSLQQHNSGDTFIDFAHRVLRRKGKKLPHKLEKGLEERYASLHPAYYNSGFDDFDIPF